MNDKGPIVILENNREVLQALETDLGHLGYSAAGVPFPELSLPDILRLAPLAVFMGLTEWDDERLHACDVVLEEDALPPEVPVLALLTANTMRKVSLKYVFADVIILPCRPPEMEFRLARAVYYRRQQVERNIIDIDEISLSLAGYEVRVRGEPVTLTLKEFELLKHLMLNNGRVFTRDALLNTIWGYDYYGGTRTVDVHIRRIRAKLGDFDETHVKTVRGIGYTFRAAP